MYNILVRQITLLSVLKFWCLIFTSFNAKRGVMWIYALSHIHLIDIQYQEQGKSRLEYDKWIFLKVRKNDGDF